MKIRTIINRLNNFKPQKTELQKFIPVFLLFGLVLALVVIRWRYSGFIYKKDYYQAFVGDKRSRGGHRVRLAKGKDFLEIFFVKAGNFEIPKLKPSSLAKLVEEDGEQMIKFEEIVEGADFFYRYTEAGIQQLMVLRNKEVGKGEFVFKLNTSGLTYNDVGDGVWYFYNKNQKPVFRFTKPYAKDLAGNSCNNVSAEIFQKDVDGKIGDFAKFKIEDEVWLTDADRQFPVAIYSNLEVVPEKRTEWSF